MAAVNLKLSPLGGAIILVVFGFVFMYAFNVSSFFRSEEKIDMKELLSVGIDLARRGGARVKAIRMSEALQEQVKGKTKEGAKEMLTDGDLESHRAIIYGFAKLYPKLKVISEEHETKPVDLAPLPVPDKNLPDVQHIDTNLKVPISDITVWIDPLDATQEYTENLLNYVTVMVCVAVKGQPAIGIIYKPFEDEKDSLAWGWVDYGNSPNVDEYVKNAKKKTHDTLIVSRSHAGSVEKVAKEALGEETEVIPAGGAGFKVWEVLKGEADAYVHVTRIKKWDICAGNAILVSARGRMTTLEGKNIDYASEDPLNDDGLLATLNNHDKYLHDLKPVFNDLRDDEEKHK